MNDLVVIEKFAQWQRLKAPLVLDSVSSPIARLVYAPAATLIDATGIAAGIAPPL